MLKPYAVRVKATHALLVRTLELINADPRSLMDAVAAADREASQLSDPAFRQRKVVLTTTRPADDEGEPIVFRGYEHRMVDSPAAGAALPRWDASRPIQVPSRRFDRERADRVVDAPLAYV